jgi:hypothetical protein
MGVLHFKSKGKVENMLGSGKTVRFNLGNNNTKIRILINPGEGDSSSNFRYDIDLYPSNSKPSNMQETDLKVK